MKTSSVTWKLARQWQTVFTDGENLALEALGGLAHGTPAATGLQDSWLTSSPSSLSPLLPSSVPQWQGQVEGWSKECPPMMSSSLVCPAAELHSSDSEESTYTARSSGCLQKQVLAFSPGSWNAEVQSKRNKSTTSFPSSSSMHSVS